MATITLANTYYQFKVSSASANATTTYTNNGVTYTVNKTISSGTILVCTAAAGSVLSGTTLTKSVGTGDATITVTDRYYLFYAAAANATVGATYTNNSVTWTVADTITASSSTYQALLMTAAPGSASSGTTLTKASGTGDSTITFLRSGITVTNESFTYAAGDTISLSGDMSWYINATLANRPGPVNCSVQASTSTIGINNSSTTTPIVISLNTENSDFNIAYQNNALLISGDWIQITTGSGLASQTIDFTSALGGVIDWPSALVVETADSRHYSITPNSGGGQGYFAPFYNLSLGTGTNTTPYYDLQNIKMLTEFYGGDPIHGNVFQYDGTVATFGKGGATGSSLGGYIPGNGKRILMPNIHFTSSVYNATWTSRNIMNVNTMATTYAHCMSFSHMFAVNGSLTGNTMWKSVMLTGRGTPGGSLGTSVYEFIAAAPDASTATTQAYAWQHGNFIGNTSYNHIYGCMKCTGTYAPLILVNNNVSLKQFSNIFGNGTGATSGTYPVIMESVLIQDDAPLSVGPFYCVGGQVYLRECDNIHITEIHNSDVATGVVTSAYSNTVFTAIGSKNFVVAKVRKLTNGAACRGGMISTDSACYQYAIKDIDYDAASNAGTAVAVQGERGYVANVNVQNPRTALFSTTAARKNVRTSNLYSNATVANATAISGQFVEWDMNSSGVYSGTVYNDSEFFQPIWTNSAKTTARLSLGPVSNDANASHLTVVSGTQGVDWWIAGNGFYAPGSNVEVIITNQWPIRGITDFSVGGGVATLTYSGFTTNAAMEFSLRVNDGTETSTWTTYRDATVYANWATSLGELSGYSSTTGFFARFRLRTSGTLSTRVYNYGFVSATPDSTWTPAEIGFVPIAVSGHVANSCVALYDNTVPASPVLVKKKILSTTTAETMDLPYNFDATAKAYKVVLRKAGYGEAIISDSSYQKGKSAPFSQVLYKTVVDATAAAITGVLWDGTNVHITETKSISDIYDSLQYQAAQVANMGYAMPIVSTDQVNFTSPCNWTIDTGKSITGSGALTLTGGATLTMTGTAASALNITHTSGTKVWTRIAISGLTANSIIWGYNSTDAVDLFDLSNAGTTYELQKEWSADKSCTLKVVSPVGATANLDFSQSFTFGSTGASISVSMTADSIYNAAALNGSTYTGITADYANQRLVFASGTSYTVPQVYARYRYLTYDTTGIKKYFGGMTMKDAYNLLINASTVPLVFNNTSGSNIVLSTGYIQRDDSASWVYASSANSFIINFNGAYIDPSSLKLIKGLYGK